MCPRSLFPALFRLNTGVPKRLQPYRTRAQHAPVAFLGVRGKLGRWHRKEASQVIRKWRQRRISAPGALTLSSYGRFLSQSSMTVQVRVFS